MKCLNDLLQSEDLKDIQNEINERKLLVADGHFTMTFYERLIIDEIRILTAWAEKINEKLVTELDNIIEQNDMTYVCDGEGFDSKCPTYLRQRNTACENCSIYKNYINYN
jgi:hypothetical protein